MTVTRVICPPDHLHAAKTTCYGSHKCRCFPCRRANADRAAQARRDPTPQTMAPEPVRAHVAYLKEFGYSYAQIARAAGVNDGTPLRLMRNRLRFVQAHVGRALLAVQPNIADLDLHTIVPSRGVRRRLEALATRGWSIGAIATHIGIGRSHLSHLAWKDGLTVRNHLLVADAYEQLWNASPPERDRWEARTVLRTRNRAARLGWASPLAWDDIDNDADPQRPDATSEPDVIAIELAVTAGARVHLTTPERHEAVRQLHALGKSDREIAKLLDVADRTILRDREALGLPAAVTVDHHPIIRGVAA